MKDKGKELRDALDRLEKCCPGSTCGLNGKTSPAELHEALLNLGEAKNREQQLREEADALLEGMDIIIRSENTRKAFNGILLVLKKLLDCDDAFVLREQRDGALATVASSSPQFEHLAWRKEAMFKHVLSGNSVNLHDISTSTDWQAQPTEMRKNVLSALHTSFTTSRGRAIIVCTSSLNNFFNKARIKLLERFVPLAGQGLYNIEINDHLRKEILERKEAEKNLAQALAALQDAKQELTRANEALTQENLERRKAEDALRVANDELELRVDQRTAELRQSNTLLQREIGERLRAEEEKEKMFSQLLQAQKMESVGQLAGGVAHDFNNILTTILGYSQMFMLTMSKDDPKWSYIESIYEAGERASSLTRQLLAFSRKQVMELKVVILDDLIKNMTKMLGRLIGEQVEMKLHLQSRAGRIKADAGQIEQIIMNLAVNARDAMPEGGCLEISTAEIILDQNDAAKFSDMTSGRYILLEVRDNGEGMTKEIQKEIFKPFFTTKVREKGTGLGLATVYGIVKQHNGSIFVESEPGQGTQFIIYFPATEEEVCESVPVLPHKDTLRKATETILVVDDDESIRHMVSDTLTPLGYRCLTAANGKEAFCHVQNSEVEIDLLLSDVVMPEMNGPELAARYRERYPQSAVIFMSGYMSNIDINSILASGNAFIKKPFTIKQLLNKFGEVLGA
jgi:signal transduction histidine kinase